MTKPVYILGTALSHDGSSCLLKDGKIVVAIEKERLTKKKHDGFNDNATIQYCLDAEGITFDDLDLIVEKNTINPRLKPQDIERRKGRIIPESVPVINISHHIAHAYSAVGTSPFNEMGVVVMDGQGSSLDQCIDVDDEKVLPSDIQKISKKDRYLYWEKESYYIFDGKKLKPVFKDFSKFYIWNREKYPAAPFDMEHSIAEFYGGISYYVFDEEFCEGKLMGLAPYGRPGKFSFDAFSYQNGRVLLKHDWMDNIKLFNGGKYQCFSEYFQYYADLAYWAQKQIENAIIYIFNSYYKMFPQKNVGYAGGLTLNAVANARLFNETKFRKFYFQPAAADNGLSIGCCYYGWLEVLKKDKLDHNESTYFGKQYKSSIVEACLEKYAENLEFEKTEEYIKKAACFISEGKVLAWFQDGSEFGPRALGHRSIVADPRHLEMRNFINRKVKFREEFRPFAPSVLAEDASIYFELGHKSPYMILVAQTKHEWRDKIPAVVHKDGSARVQTVSKNIVPKYHSLLEEFKKISGISVVLNTSFNGPGMPIVETPGEAIDFFIKTKALDVLVIDKYIVRKKSKIK